MSKPFHVLLWLSFLLSLHTYSQADQSLASSFEADLKTGEHYRFKQQGYYVHYTRWTPDQSNGHIIVYNHGMQSHRGWFNATAETLRTWGYTIYAFDRIGSGTSSPVQAQEGYPFGLEDFISFLPDTKVVFRRGHTNDYKLHLVTLDKMLDIAEHEHPNKKLHLWANSYGSKIVSRYLMDVPRAQRITSSIFTTPGLYRNETTMPLTVSKWSIISGKNTDLFPSPVSEKNNDNGAAWFTSDSEWANKIINDKFSIRYMTRATALQTKALDNYIDEHAHKLNDQKRFYLLVNNDAMMDNEKVLQHIKNTPKQGIYKVYSGGHDHKHFLTFTSDRDQVLNDIHQFVSGGYNQIVRAQFP